MRNQKNIDAEVCHRNLMGKMPLKYSYNEKCNYAEWKKNVAAKFCELTGLNRIKENECPLNVQIEWTEKKDGYTLTRFTFDSERGETVPCYLLIPETGKNKYPVAITLQGHSTGFHNSIGEPQNDGDQEYALGRGQFAVQAVRQGFIALAIEQRGMGERRSRISYGKDNTYRPRGHMCAVPALTALSLGRTLLGERIWDVHKAIDALESFPECDMDKILITGNSAGGTMSYYAACFDERIKLSVPSCSFCSYKTSILSIEHCVCNYIPNVCDWFEMEDLSCLIAPRSLVVCAGKIDEIFPIEGVRDSFVKVQKIYNNAKAGMNCRLVETPKGHWWCSDIVWNAINAECTRLGWK